MALKKPHGRPTLYSEDVASRILEEVASGMSLRQVCKAEDLPHEATVRLWRLEGEKYLVSGEAFSTRYTRALESQAEAIFEEALEIADTALIGEKVKTSSDGKTETQTGDMVERAKLKVETRKWFLSKLLPKKYGDKLDIHNTGEIKTVHSYAVPGTRAIEGPEGA